jgi:hypothetical protein
VIERWFAPVPAARVRVVTVLVFGYAAAWLVVRGPYIRDVTRLPARRFAGVGLFDIIGVPPSGVIVLMIWLAGIIGCAAVVAGRGVRVAAPIGAAAVWVIGTLTSSYGQVFHTEHLLVLQLAILAAAAAVEPIAPEEETSSGWPLRLSMVVVSAVYVVAGIAKLRHGGIDWLTGDALRSHVAADNLRKVLLDDPYSRLGGWLAGTAWIWPPIGLLTIAVEIGAPLALIPGRFRYAWVAIAWGFHVGVLALMWISFPYQLTGVAYAAFLPVERLVELPGRVFPTRRRGAATSRAAGVTA